MPFESESQRRFLWANHPDIAKRWAKETPKGKLPYHIKTGGTKLSKTYRDKGNQAPQGKKRVGGTFGRKARIMESLGKAKKMKGTRHVVPAQMA